MAREPPSGPAAAIDRFCTRAHDRFDRLESTERAGMSAAGTLDDRAADTVPSPPVQAVVQAILFGLRLSASVLLALFVAYKLELPNAFWAGTSAGIVCQPVLGASLRKGRFRAIGTVIGAIAIVVLTAAFPQSRFGMLAALTLWCGLCGFLATILRNFASYAAALAGYTAAIVFADAVNAPGEAFELAVMRGTEIGVGIVSAGLVLTLTDFGQARPPSPAPTPRRSTRSHAGSPRRSRSAAIPLSSVRAAAP
jgi:hypothetical protein